MKRPTIIILLYFAFFSDAFAQNRITTDTLDMRSENKDLVVLTDSIQTLTEPVKPVITRVTLEIHVSDPQDTIALSGEERVQVLTATLDAGRTEATLDVSASGGATYTLPFTLPPGINNVVPQLGLMYNSQGGNGTAGYGWNVYGLSGITRIGAAEYTDDRVGGINFNINDRFALDGQRLLLKSGTYGGDGAEYQTEQYSNLKIISYGVSPYGSEYGPAHFEVHYPDGSKAFYGQTVNSSSRLQYGLTYTENPQGIRASYEYTTSGNNLYISRVLYGSRGTTPGINRIEFSYTAASRAEQNYVAGTGFYADRRISKISVIANGSDYRHYVPTYGTVGTLNYQRLTQIREFDGTETRSLAPITFSYSSTGNVITSQAISNLSLTGIASNNSQVTTADFTGDGNMDFILYPNSKDKFYYFYDLETGDSGLNWGDPIESGPFREIFPMTWLTSTEKILSGQGMVLARNNGTNKYKFDVYGYSAAFPMLYQYTKLWDDPPLTPGYYSECDEQYHDGLPHNFEFVSGDFNGDGLTDIMAISRRQYVKVYEYWNPFFEECTDEYDYSPSLAAFINMDRRKAGDNVSNISFVVPYFEVGDRLYAADFDGDGKTDILIVKTGSMHVFSLNDNNILTQKWSTTDSRIITLNTRPILLGDYNGDGKMDIMFSTGYNNLFATFMSTGKGFVKHEKNQPFSNIENTWDGNNTMQQHVLLPTDINNDGKTDIIYSRTTTYNSTATGSIYTVIHHNTNIDASNTPVFGNSASSTRSTNVRHNPIPIFLNPDRQNADLEYGYISDNTITLFRSQKDMLKESQLAQVSQDDVTHTVHYSRLMEDSYVNDMLLYQGSLEQTFPYIDIQFAPQLYVVDRVARTAIGNTVQQIFGYRKAVSNADGLGFLGFGETIRSNLHINSLDSNRMFTICIQNPQLRGANLRAFTSKSSYLSQTIKDMPLSNPPPVGGVPDGATLFDYINRRDQVYYTDTLANKVFVNVPISSSSKDLLHGTYQNSRLQYDSLYNVTHTWEDINGTASKSSGMGYANNTSTTNYHVGRLLNQKDTMANQADTITSETQYTYTGYLPTVVKQKGHHTDFMIDSLTYDLYGNVTQRKMTVPNGDQRTEIMEYDASGRFLTTYTDTDTLVTHYSYNDATGDLDGKTDPYGRNTTYQYDNWGRQTVYKDYLDNSTTTTYARLSTSIYITELADDGAQTLTLINPLGEKREQHTKAVTGSFISMSWRYDAYGRQIQESAPGSTTQWNTINFDSYGRINREISYTGKTNTYSYNGLVSSINDGIKTVTTTRDAPGNIVSVQDPGGTVNYTYFADGNLRTADYGGSIQTVEQDGWGRKIKLTDPSAGIYEYEFDGWGQITKEITPKGETEYVYDEAGKLTFKSIIGDSTDMQQTYTYDPVKKLLVEINLTNSDGNHSKYSYSYNAYSNPSLRIEENIYVAFAKSYHYDSFGKLARESFSAEDKIQGYDNGIGVDYTYKNGQLEKIIASGQVLWQIDSLDNKGQLAKISHGNHQFTRFTSDSYGFPQQQQLIMSSGTPATLMTLGTTFNAQRGFPTARSNSTFSWNEAFGYDNLDRLINFNDNNGNQSQQYDVRGRITENSRQGIYGYTGSHYQQQELELNPAADTYYQTREIQNITYNAFKNPVEIHEPGHDRISFQYNSALRRSHMYYGGEEANPLNRRYHRHYAEDGSAEMTRDTQTGEISFIFYLGGDAYSAPAIWKVFSIEDTGKPEGIFFLHRDYLGSIIMITDTLANIVEKRHFDAWGNIVKLTDGNNNNLPNFVILDRGFTGHEHLTSVGLIHMNGRLYDARLGRFLAPDNYVQDPYGTQSFNRYGYALNNPLVYVDPDGEFFLSFLIPGVGTIIDGILWGAVIGAGTSAAVYSVSAAITGDWSWKGLGNAVAMGAVGGAIGGGFGALGSLGSLGSFGNSIGYNILSQGANMGLTNAMFGNEITWGSVAGVVAGGLAGTFLPRFNAVKGGAFKNAAVELGFNTARGAATGLVSGLAQWGVDREKPNLWQSALGGAAGGAGSTLFNLTVFGPAVQFDDSYIPHGKDRPIHREGGLSDWLGGTGISWGRTAYTSNFETDAVRIEESFHYFQQKQLGFAGFYGRIFYEALRFGSNGTYNTYGTLEYQASHVGRDYYYYRKPYRPAPLR